jgi:hypothetical protein
VHVEDVPVLHEGCVLGQQHILHVLEVVFGHLVVHLVLESLQTAHEFAFPVHRLQLFEEVIFGLLPILSRPQEGQGHVLPGRSRVEDHHLDGRDISFQLIFDRQEDGFLDGLGKVKTDVEIVLFLSVGFLEIGHYFFPGSLDLRPRAYDGNFLIFLLDVIERVVYLFEG